MQNKVSPSKPSGLMAVLKNLIPPDTDIVLLQYGEVIELNPLKLQLENNLIVDEDFLLLSNNVKEQIIKIPNAIAPKHNHTIEATSTSSAGDPSHSHTIAERDTLDSLETITLWRGLKVGDRVILIPIQNGYYVTERIGDLDDS